MHDKKDDNNQVTGLSIVGSSTLANELEPTGRLTPAADFRLEGKELYFSRYREDGRLRLYKPGSMLSDEPAGYSQDPVVVKILVKGRSSSFMVCLPVRRAFLDHPLAEQELAQKAWDWR